MDDARHVPPAAAWLGAAGLIPFVAGAAGLWLLDAPRHDVARALMLGYGAVILSFVGAVHWGLAIARAAFGAPPAAALALGVLPALIGWSALALPPAATLTVLAAGFVVAYRIDARAVACGLAPAWYRRLRLPLTACVVTLLGVSLAALLVRGTV